MNFFLSRRCSYEKISILLDTKISWNNFKGPIQKLIIKSYEAKIYILCIYTALYKAGKDHWLTDLLRLTDKHYKELPDVRPSRKFVGIWMKDIDLNISE